MSALKPKPRPPQPRPKHVPETPAPPDVFFTFFWHPEKRTIHVTGTVTPSPAVATDQDNDLQIIVSLNGGANEVLDCGPPPGTPMTFTCNAGDSYVITQIDFNVVGASPASTPLTGTVFTIVTPPTAVPTTPGVPTVVFSN